MNYEYFLYKIRRTVYKWWCVVYRPVYKLTHHGYWPDEKNPYMVYPDLNTGDSTQTPSMSSDMQNATPAEDHDTPTYSNDVPSSDAATAQQTAGAAEATTESSDSGASAGFNDDALRRANEIMERLAKEASEDEAKKQDEIKKAREKAAEDEMLASIMKANKVDISGFIEEGRSKQDS